MATRVTKDQRREEILKSTWRLIARDGLAATNMRALAAEAGYANGALAYYFEGKDALLRAAYEHVLKQTMERVGHVTRGLRGLPALRAFCGEIVPDDELKLMEARVVVPFWSTALVQQDFAGLFARDMAAWRVQLRGYLKQAVLSKELPPPTDERALTQAVDSLLAMLCGMQVLAVLNPKHHSPRVMREMVDGFLRGIFRAS